MASELERLFVTIGADLKGYNKGLAEAGRKMKTFGKNMAGIGKQMSMKLTAPIVGVGVAALKMSMDFNKSMANVATLIPGNVERVNELKKGVQDLAVKVGKSTGDLAGGLYQVVSAFGDTADSMKILELTAKAGVAGLASTTDALNLASAVTKGYGDTSAAANEKALDLAFTTVRLGQTTFPQLAASMGRVVAQSKKLKVSQEEMFAVYATLTGVTGDAARVTTQYAGIQNALMAPTKEMAIAIDELGQKMGFVGAEAMVGKMGLVPAMRALIETTDGSVEAVRKLFTNIEALPAVFALSGGQADSFDQKLAAMSNTSGALTEAFKEQTEGINKAGHAWNQFKQQLAVTAQIMGDVIAPAFTAVLEPLKKMLEWFRELDPATQKWTVAVVALMAVLGPILIITGQLVIALSALSGAIITVTGALFGGAGLIVALKAVTGSIVIVEGHIVAVGAGLVGLSGIILATGGALALLILKWQAFQDAMDAVGIALTKGLTRAKEYYDGLRMARLRAAAEAEAAALMTAKEKAAIDALGVAFNNLVQNMDAATGATKDTTDAIEEVGDVSEEAAAALRKEAAAMKEIEGEAGAAAKALDKVTAATERATRAAQTLSVTRRTETRWAGPEDAVGRLMELGKQYGGGLSRFTKMIQQAMISITGFPRELKPNIEEMLNFVRVMVQAGRIRELPGAFSPEAWQLLVDSMSEAEGAFDEAVGASWFTKGVEEFRKGSKKIKDAFFSIPELPFPNRGFPGLGSGLAMPAMAAAGPTTTAGSPIHATVNFYIDTVESEVDLERMSSRVLANMLANAT